MPMGERNVVNLRASENNLDLQTVMDSAMIPPSARGRGWRMETTAMGPDLREQHARP